MKKTILRTLLIVVILALIAGVRTFFTEKAMNDKIDDLAGVYTTLEDNTDSVQDLLTLVDLSQEELALTGDVELKLVKTVEFTQNRTYRFGYDAQQSRQHVRAMYADALDALYQGRATLTSLYGDEVATATQEEFRQFYAELYSFTSYDELLDALADNAFDYDILGEDFETGTYTVEGKKIMCTITGESEAEYLNYHLDGDTLTLTYSDMEETYTRAN